MTPVTSVCLRMPLSSRPAGPRIKLRALQRILSRRWLCRWSGPLKGRNAHLVIVGPGHERRHMMAMAAVAIRLAGPDPEWVRGASAIASCAALL